MKQRKHHPKGQDEPQTITKAVTHIRLEAANAGKLAALDDLAQVYLPLCQHYVTLFCTDEQPDKFRTNREQAYQDYVDDLLDYHEQQAEGILEAEEPAWRSISAAMGGG